MKYVTEFGDSWSEFEEHHGVPKPQACLLIYTKIPSSNSSLKDAKGFHHAMIAISKLSFIVLNTIPKYVLNEITILS